MKLSKCLSDIGITDASTFDGCDDIEGEFKVIRKSYLAKARTDHPDKGGDAAVFRTTQAAWEVLRDTYHKGVKGGSYTCYFVSVRKSNVAASTNDNDDDDEEYYANDDPDDDYDDELYKKYAHNTATQSYEYYEAAAQEDVPGYRVELAKSNRSKCVKSGAYIVKGDVRVGILDKMAGTYGRWHKLDQWRVPVKFQNGLTNPSDEQTSLRDLLAIDGMMFVGLRTLDDASKMEFVRYCIDRHNWASTKGTKRKIENALLMEGEEGVVPTAISGEQATTSMAIHATAAAAASQNILGPVPVIVPGSFRILVPGVDGARLEGALTGQSFVISGTFPEAGGVDAGVGNVKAMIESFGGWVITRFSKKTTHLLVGKDAVVGKFKDAIKRSVVIVNLQRLQGLLLNHHSLEQMDAMPTLTGVEFQGHAYQPAGPPPPFNTAVSASAAAASTSVAAASASAAATVAKMPSKTDPLPSCGAIAPVILRNSKSTEVVPHIGKKAKFTIPRPGVNGGVAGVLNGKRFVLTGIFPEVGGGTGLTLGKDRTKDMIESFGGVVTSAVSGKTDFVLMGQEPGRSKVSKADERGIPLIDLIVLNRLLLGQATLEATASAPPPRITHFSAGYAGPKRIAY